MAAKAKWTMETEYIQSCNCAYGCPCNFNALPTTGNCEALLGYRIKKGVFEGTKLDGAKVAWGLWWPKAIHQGGGVGRVYIDPGATRSQRDAIEKIWSGKYGGGVFTIFNSTFARTLPPRSAKIDWKFQGYESGFSVAGVGEVRSAHIRNAVTGASFEGQVVLPGGINFKKAHVTSIERLSIHDEAPLDFEHSNTSGFVTTTKYTDTGPVSSRV